MGEIADQMIDGQCCDVCACVFQGPDGKEHVGTEKDPFPYWSHGYPATCWDCWDDMTPRERKNHARATQPTY